MEQWKLAAVMGAVALGGAAVGGWLFGVDHASAQAARPQAFRECFTARQESVDVGNDGMIARPHVNEIVYVPEGWTVVAGGGLAAQGQSAIVFCH